MREEPTRSLLLLDANPEERRLISAIAGRAGWSVVGAADEETALALLQGPHGREVQSVLLGSWDAEKGPQLISALRDDRANLPVIVLSQSDAVSVAVEAMQAGASDFLVRPVAPERLLEALAANADRRRAAGELAPVSEKLAPPLALEQLIGAGPEFRAALAVAASRRATASLYSSLASPARARKRSLEPSIAPVSAQKARCFRSIARQSPRTSSTASCSAMKKAPFPARLRPRRASSSRPTGHVGAG